MNSSVPVSGARRVSQSSSERWVLLCLGMTMMLASLGTSIANVALPAIADSFDASFRSVQWIVLAYLLTTTTFVVSAGRLGDLLGRNRLLASGTAVFAVGSLVCAFAPTLSVLIAARAVQGFGAAFMLALSLASVSSVVSAKSTGRAIGILGTTSAVGTALGPSAGGLLIAAFGWRAPFLALHLVAVVALLLSRLALPVDQKPRVDRQKQFDFAGTVLLAVVLAAFALAMTFIRTASALQTGFLVLVIIAALIRFVQVESRTDSPLIDLAIIGQQLTSVPLIMNGLVSTVMMATLIVGPFYLKQGLGLNAAMVGLILSTGPLVVVSTGLPIGRLVDRIGPDRVTGWALAAMGAGTTMLIAVSGRGGVPGYVGAILVLTLGYAGFQTANNTSVMRDADSRQRGVLSGMISLSRNLGLITGAALMGAIFVTAVGHSGVADANPAQIAHGMRITFMAAIVPIGVAIVLARRPTRSIRETGSPQVARHS